MIEKGEAYFNSVSGSNYDVIIIDGENRFQFASNALSKLNEDGFIILDNSDWFGKTSKLLRESGLIEIDFYGFGPINNYTWPTSIYLKSGVDISFKNETNPIHSVGSIKHFE